MEEEEEDGFGAKEITFILLGLIAVFLVFFFFGMKPEELKEEENLQNVCGDGTSYGECSDIKPYFCQDGFLVQNSEVCGCEDGRNASGNTCASQYQLFPEEKELSYSLLGQKEEISFISYKGFAEYISEVPKTIDSFNGQVPSRRDFKLKVIDNEQQKELLMPLVVEIQNSQAEKINQLRAAVSLVQHIPYVASGESESLSRGQFNYSRYPYEVLYYGEGICGEKSALMAFLLREIGYDVAILYFAEENHEVVGIKCPMENSFRETGYCFVETSGPSIISDGDLTYIGGIKLNSQPEVLKISDGISLPEDIEEYEDAKTLDKIRRGSLFVFNKAEKFNALKEKYGLVEEYGIE